MSKPKYNILQNSLFMIRLAWQNHKSVLAIVLGLIACGVAGSLLELFVVPAVLSAVERGASPLALAEQVGLFTLALIAVHALQIYLDKNALFGRIAVRSHLCLDIHMAFCRTAFPHTEDPAYIKRMNEAARCVEGNNEAGEAIWMTLTDLMANFISFLFYLLLLVSVGPGIVALTAALAAVGCLAGEQIRAWQYRHQDEAADIGRRQRYLTICTQDTTLAKDIRIFGLGSWLAELLDKYDRLCQDFYSRQERVKLWADALDVVLALLRNGVAYGWLITLALRGELGAAEFVLYFSAVGGFTQWVTGIFSGLSELHRQSMDLSVLREFLEIPEPFQFEDGAPLPVKPDHLYTLELRDVSFRYPGADHDTLSHLNLTIQPGEKLAVVGRNGAGKTTLIKLLCGLYDPTEGQVLLDGQDIRQFNRRDYYQHFSAVFQRFSLMAGTVAENVAQTMEPDLPRVWDCLEQAGMAEVVRALPRGEQTHLGREVFLDGQDLSGGQLQRLMLARALYKGAPVVLLDEPTAALDPIAESDLYRKYNDLTRQCTSVYISHRLASTRFCNRVLLLEDGGIAEEGTHESLLALEGSYARLFAIQSKYYQEGEMDHD